MYPCKMVLKLQFISFFSRNRNAMENHANTASSSTVAASAAPSGGGGSNSNAQTSTGVMNQNELTSQKVPFIYYVKHF